MWLMVPPAERRPDPEPLATDDRRAVVVGTLVWAVLAVACVVARDRLAAQGTGWWLEVCVAGALLGLAGLAHLQRREGLKRRGLRR
ncbi:Protein of unknown function [Quadrisphaera sp. DSM 44207]|nr:Protein of unknown function [Quadrisphaera sp. DSM 44207]